jgi:TonB-linked SusC/RagA family outer membrane protein
MNKIKPENGSSEMVFITIMKVAVILFIVGSAAFTNINAQSKNIIKGTVVDAKGEYIIGANIVIKGTSKGTITDLNGKFTLECPISGKLIISYLGYNAQEVDIVKGKELNIVMEETTKSIDEVVVIGYGTVNKKDLTGSVAAVKMEDVQKNVGASFQEAMGGKIAGVQATSLSGKPGEVVDIVIRGGNSITQSNAPLYVVDGFPMTDETSAGLISPDDIESINILKDASATAIYGARGANGVIMITTKKGVKGKPSIQYNGYYGIQETNAKVDVLDPYEFVKLQMQLYPTSAKENYLDFRKMTVEDYKNMPMLKWQDHVFQPANIQNHYLSVSGRMDRTLYSVSATYHNQSGVIITSGSKRYTTRVNLEQRFSDNFKVGATGSYSVGTITGVNPDSQSSYVLESMWGTRPFLYNSENLYEMEQPENLDATDRQANPIANLIDTKSENKTTSLSGNVFLEYQLLTGLRLRLTGGINQLDYDNSIFYGARTSNARFTAQGVQGKITQLVNNSFVNENTLSYTNTFKKNHKIDAVTGFTLSGRKSEGYIFGATNLPYESLGLSGLEDGIALKVNATSSEWRLMSFLGRFNYSYKSRYLFTTSFRADGSSKFSVDNRWAFFPSGSAAWVVSQEPFMRDLKPYISDLKVRASWGRTGNNNVSDFASRGQLKSDGMIYPFGGLVNNSAMIMSKMDNIALKWETTEQFDFGTEFSLFKDKVKVEIDYYDKKTFDLLLNADLPYSSGYAQAEKNVGSVRNQGVEFTINTNIVNRKNFDWNLNFNISTNKNTVLALADGQRSMTRNLTFFADVPAYIAIVGQPLSLMYGYVYDGLLQESDFYKDASGNYSLKPDVAIDRPSVQPGFMKFKDLNNDGKIDASDRTIIGNANPLFIGGINNTFKIYDFDLSVFIQGSFGNDILNGNKYAYTSASMLNRNYSVDILRSWTPANTDTDIPLAGSQRTNLTYNSWMVEDGSYLRLKTLQLGYTLPEELTKKIKISSVRFYATFSNVFTVTKYSGFDPEVSTQFSNMTRGFDFSSYPRSLMAVFGANVKF